MCVGLSVDLLFFCTIIEVSFIIDINTETLISVCTRLPPRSFVRPIAQIHFTQLLLNDPYRARVKLQSLDNILGKAGKGSLIEPPFNPDYGSNIILGNDCFINFK